ncbi:MAG TPA: WbqC family protein [Bacteroidales bacterium]|nr:WbqC family protein [Bacteroidales bacterium]
MQRSESALLSIAYLPPVQYMTKFLAYERVYIEIHENFQKQSYRNRCVIYGANGPLTLVIPVKKKHSIKNIITDIRIDYNTEWQNIHWKSLVSAYQNSPFFEFYRDEIYQLIVSKDEFLVDFNLKLLNQIFSLLNMDKSYSLSKDYFNHAEYHDYRQSINPKKRLQKSDRFFQPVRYQQVFVERCGFIPNLSVVDLIFNVGPDSRRVLEESIRRGQSIA